MNGAQFGVGCGRNCQVAGFCEGGNAPLGFLNAEQSLSYEERSCSKKIAHCM
jgi:hypothetical protein